MSVPIRTFGRFMVMPSRRIIADAATVAKASHPRRGFRLTGASGRGVMAVARKGGLGRSPTEDGP